MKSVDIYLNQLQEQFSARVGATEIHGEFQKDWTDCYTSKCQRIKSQNKFDIKYCKADCQIAAANKAITSLNSIKSKCTANYDPNRCIKSIENRVQQYRDKIAQARKMQDDASSKESEFRQKSGV